MNTGFSLRIFITLVASFFIWPLQAAWYQVEVIVFENLESVSNGELWYENPGLPDRSNSIALITELADNEEGLIDAPVVEGENQIIQQNKAELIPYLQIAEGKLRMDGIHRVLKLSREYRPHMHVSWQQPGLSSAIARAVHIQKFAEPDLITREQNLGQTENNSGVLSDEMENKYQVKDLIFDGTIRLRSSRFLHVDVDIAYFPEFLSEQNETINEDNSLFVQQQADYVRLQESRKIKLNEIHYFDHPFFGVIIRASRLNLN